MGPPPPGMAKERLKGRLWGLAEGEPSDQLFCGGYLNSDSQNLMP